MKRRQFLGAAVTLSAAAAAVSTTRALMSPADVKGIATEHPALKPPASGTIPVAMVISDGVNVIDLSGPWGVFESVQVPGSGFELFTVSDKQELVSSGTGLRLMPGYTYENAPAPKVVVVPAQRGSDQMRAWLKKVSESAEVTMSVCTGAFHLAKAGLLSGRMVTTHHEFFDKLEKEYPDIRVKRGVRFVEGERISTAGGLTSGTDLALRVVERYYGRSVAQSTATYMEYQGQGWIV